jgi:spore germination protein YaaH
MKRERSPDTARWLVPLLLALSLTLSAFAQEERTPSVHRSFLEMYRADTIFAPAGPGYTIPPRALRKPAGLSHEVFGYLPYWFASRWRLIDYSLVSTIAYFSAEANGDGTIGSTRGWPRTPGDPAASADVVAMIEEAHTKGVRVVLCVTLFDAGSIEALVGSPTARTALIRNSLALVQAGGGDGVTIDFEGIPGAARDGVTEFMRALADTFHAHIPGSQVSCSPTDFDTRSGDWDIAAIAPFVDLFFFQGYGYGYSGSPVTTPVGLLPNTAFWGGLNITTLIDFVLPRIGTEKVLLGLPHFGYRWPCVSGDPKAATTGSGVAFYYPDAVAAVATYGRQWETAALNPWYRYESGGSWFQGWYDDPESMEQKYRFALEKGLRGVGMWSLGMDGANHEIWDQLAHYFTDSTFVLPEPRTPVLAVVKDTVPSGTIVVRWSAAAEEHLGGFRLFLTGIADAASPPYLDEGTLTAEVREAVLGGLPPDSTLFVRLVAVDTSGTRTSDTSDSYPVRIGPGSRYLIVDGFDRVTASYSIPRHTFAGVYADALSANGRTFDTGDNDAVRDGRVPLEGYAGVVWFLGDESVADRTFDAAEQAVIAGFLEGGGRLFVTGSEVGYDLGRSGSPNYSPAWFTTYLKAVYAGDDAGTTSCTGIAGSDFEGITGTFGQTYVEDYPDYFQPAGGGAGALYYNSGPLIAGIQYRGAFGSGTNEGCLVYMGFPFETMGVRSERLALMERTVGFLEGSATGIRTDASPATFSLEQNFPNPFNPTTTVEFTLSRGGPVSLTVYDMLGREVVRLVEGYRDAGRHRVLFESPFARSPHASGFYVYRLLTREGALQRTMLLLK